MEQKCDLNCEIHLEMIYDLIFNKKDKTKLNLNQKQRLLLSNIKSYFDTQKHNFENIEIKTLLEVEKMLPKEKYGEVIPVGVLVNHLTQKHFSSLHQVALATNIDRKGLRKYIQLEYQWFNMRLKTLLKLNQGKHIFQTA